MSEDYRKREGRLRILISGIEFGWGSAGKLSSILQAFRNRAELEIIGVGTALGRPVLADQNVVRWYSMPEDAGGVTSLLSETDPDFAIVVLDPRLAENLQRAGCPVVYVDSLPFMWTEYDPIPHDVALYCAQETLPLPPAAEHALSRVRHLFWVPPIVPDAIRQSDLAKTRGQAQPERDPDLAVVNFGGVYSPFVQPEDQSYQQLVLLAALEALHSVGATRIIVTGNVDPEAVPDAPLGTGVEVHRYAHHEFVDTLARAGHILSSPGLTTILELAALDRAAILLPPQNLSQVFNGSLVAQRCDKRLCITWPEAMLPEASVSAWQMRGQGYAVKRIRENIRAAADSVTMRLAVQDDIAMTLKSSLKWVNESAPSFAPISQNFHGADRIADEALRRLAPRASSAAKSEERPDTV